MIADCSGKENTVANVDRSCDLSEPTETCNYKVIDFAMRKAHSGFFRDLRFLDV